MVILHSYVSLPEGIPVNQGGPPFAAVPTRTSACQPDTRLAPGPIVTLALTIPMASPQLVNFWGGNLRRFP